MPKKRTTGKEGGRAIGQHVKSAQHDCTPASPIGTSQADCIPSPPAMPGQSGAHGKNIARHLHVKQSAGRRTPDEARLREFYALLLGRTRHDVSSCKVNTVCRRIERRNLPLCSRAWQWELSQLRDVLEKRLRRELTTDIEVSVLFPPIGERVFCPNARRFEWDTGLPGTILPAMEGVSGREGK